MEAPPTPSRNRAAEPPHAARGFASFSHAPQPSAAVVARAKPLPTAAEAEAFTNAALVDQLLDHCHIVNIRGNSFRMRLHSQSSADACLRFR
jgi:hypothetical protein